MKIQEVNVTSTVAENEEQMSRDIFFLNSSVDLVLLTAADGHALSDWIIDSGASLHVSPHKEWFTTKDQVRLGNEQTCEILGVGDVQLKFQNGSSFMLKNVRHVPAITKRTVLRASHIYASHLFTFLGKIRQSLPCKLASEPI